MLIVRVSPSLFPDTLTVSNRYEIRDFMGDHKRPRVVTFDEEDIISNLPQDLIDQILERLPIKDAVRTSVLSKQWRYKWTTMSTLNLQFSKARASRFLRSVNHIMIHRNGPILKFHLHIPKIYLKSYRKVNQSMSTLSRRGVRELILMSSYRIYRAPSFVFSCLELRKLGLYRCSFKPPLEFQGFPNLEDFGLTKVDFGGNVCRSVINLPQLKALTLDRCFNVNNFHIKAAKLEDLWVFNCPDAMLLRLLDSEHLGAVHISLAEPVEYLPRVERLSLATMLSKLSNMMFFTIDGYFLRVLAAEKFPKWLPHVVKCLRSMELLSFSFGDLGQVQGALCMLRNSPNLQELRVTRAQMGRDADLELTSSYLESPDCLQTLSMLQTVEITSIEGSRPELLFIKLLLQHSRRLKNIIIRPRATADTQERLNIAKDLMILPRASKKAKMFYLDPQPRFYENV